MSATTIEYPCSNPGMKAYWDRKERELRGIMAGPTSTVTLELPKPLADHLVSISQQGNPEDVIIKWLWSTYRTPMDAELEKQHREKLGLDKIVWTPCTPKA